MKKLVVILLAGCTLVISQGFKEVTAHQGWTPLEDLAGTYALTAQGSFFFCFTSAPPFPAAACGSPGPAGIPVSAVEVGVITSDTAGNSCETFTQVNNDLPVSAVPPGVSVFRVTATVTSYDPTTGLGDTSWTEYVGGQCHGATFESKGATTINTGTYHFAVSNRGKRLDGVVTSLINPEGAIGGFSLPFTFLRH